MRIQIFVLLCVAAFTWTCGAPMPKPNAGNNPDSNAEAVSWGIVIPTMQLVQETANGERCPSGWSLLADSLSENGLQNLPPIQPKYVYRFRTLAQLDAAVREAYEALPELARVFPTVRIPLVWPCFMESDAWRREFSDLFRNLVNAGIHVELTLSHHDSFPAALWEDRNGPGVLASGWAHQGAPDAFTRYAEAVYDELGHVLPEDTTVYLVNEPVSALLHGYAGYGSWPPGGKRAGRSLGQALRHMRDGLIAAARTLQHTGWRVGVIHAVRPMTDNGPGSGSAETDYVVNWWLPDALHHGCVDDDFDGSCEAVRDPALIDVFGVSFYGTMRAGADELTLHERTTIRIPESDVRPDVRAFARALSDVKRRYSNQQVTVGEIGFSSADSAKQGQWLAEYQHAMREHSIREATLHTLFEAAEWSGGEWRFHLAEGCSGSPCRITPWGRQAAAVVRMGKE